MLAAAADITVRKVFRHLLPLAMLLLVFNLIDRTNIGFAALQMNADLGFTPSVYGLAAGIFFIGYFLFEVPSNLVLVRVGARPWLARIMITWGVVVICMAWVKGVGSFYSLRFLLGRCGGRTAARGIAVLEPLDPAAAIGSRIFVPDVGHGVGKCPERPCRRRAHAGAVMGTARLAIDVCRRRPRYRRSGPGGRALSA